MGNKEVIGWIVDDGKLPFFIYDRRKVGGHPTEEWIEKYKDELKEVYDFKELETWTNKKNPKS
jgi:hypothetical protein